MSESEGSVHPSGKSELDVSDLRPLPLSSKRSFKSPARLAQITQGALFVYLVAALTGSAFTTCEIALLYRDTHGKTSPMALWNANEQFWNYYGYVYSTIFWGTIIPFALWIYRVAANGLVLNPNGLRDTPAMCVIWYFIPIANLFKPFLGMKEINAVSSSHGYFSAAKLLPWWWALWLLTGWIGSLFEIIWARIETNEEILIGDIFYQITFLGECALTILAVIIIRRITHAQLFHYDPACPLRS